MHRLLGLFALLAAGGGAAVARAEEVRIAVAANFTGTAQAIAGSFTKQTGHHLSVISGATGKLYAQIESGAPFDIFLAADEQSPAKLESEGRAVSGSRFTYAVGRLVLWSAKPGLVDARGAVLGKGAFQHLAIANPKLAPYGAAAMDVLGKLGLADQLRPKLIEGENIAQTYAFVATGNAELGFVALSQVASPAGKASGGSTWLVPQDLYAPIRQQAVWLRSGEKSAAARAFMTYLRGTEARTLIRAAGYDLPEAGR